MSANKNPAVDAWLGYDRWGFPDDLKFRSCLTLFDQATSEPIFGEALRRYFAGKPDLRTIAGLETAR